MKEAKSREQSKVNGRAAGELRVVAINSKPAPDAESRLRRLFTLLLELTSEDRDPAPEEGVPVETDAAEGDVKERVRSDPEQF